MKRLLVCAVLLVGCTDKAKSPPPAPLQKPAPLEPLVVARSDGGTADATFTVQPFTFVGGPVPDNALRLGVAGEALTLAGAPTSLEALKPRLAAGAAVLLTFDTDTFLAQTLPLLALLDDTHAAVFLQSPDVPAIAWPVTLRDETNFNAWLDETVAGKLRIVHRSDGFELQTNMGKMAGADAKGPSVPTRGGAMDLVTLQKGLERVKARFPDAPDVCFMPTYGMTLHDATRAIASNWRAKDDSVFPAACLVYPRPGAPKK